MACWVAPTVAVELWGMPLDHVMGRIEDGSLRSKTENGFLFVDVMPETAAPAGAPAPMPAGPAPATFMSVSDAELAALAAPAPASSPFVLSMNIKYSEDEADGGRGGNVVEPFVDEETPDFSAKDWRRVRAQTARTRRPPGAAVVVETYAA
jgi:hypothetical protein